MLAAGPAANFCTGPLFLWAALHVPGTRWQPAWFFLSFAASFSFIVAAFNLFPFRITTGSYSDGARILQLLTNSPVTEFYRTMNRLQSLLVTHQRFRDLDPDAFLLAASLFPQEKVGLHLRLCAAQCFEDSGRLPEAQAAIAAAESIYDNFAIDLTVPLHTIFIYSHACLNHDSARARIWWDRMAAKKPKELDFDFWLARAALLWIEGHLKEAEEAWQKADSKEKDLPQFGAYDFDRYRCGLLRRELDLASSVLPNAQITGAEPLILNPT